MSDSATGADLAQERRQVLLCEFAHRRVQEDQRAFQDEVDDAIPRPGIGKALVPDRVPQHPMAVFDDVVDPAMHDVAGLGDPAQCVG